MLWLTAAPQHVHRVGEQIAAHDQVAFAAAVSGSKNLMAVVICRDVHDLYEYLTTRLGPSTRSSPTRSAPASSVSSNTDR